MVCKAKDKDERLKLIEQQLTSDGVKKLGKEFIDKVMEKIAAMEKEGTFALLFAKNLTKRQSEEGSVFAKST